MNTLCKKTSNNKYFDAPPRMSDGRHFTDYRQNCTLNYMLGKQNRITNSHDYRTFLTHNAHDLILLNRAFACEKNCYNSCGGKTMVDEQTIVKCNTSNCQVIDKNPDGIGQGRDYGIKYNNSTQPFNKGVNNCVSAKERYNYYGDTNYNTGRVFLE